MSFAALLSIITTLTYVYVIVDTVFIHPENVKQIPFAEELTLVAISPHVATLGLGVDLAELATESIIEKVGHSSWEWMKSNGWV